MDYNGDFVNNKKNLNDIQIKCDVDPTKKLKRKFDFDDDDKLN